MRTRLISLFLLAGCWITEPEVARKVAGEADADTDADADLDPIDVTGVEPGYGTTAGGAEVVVTASPLDGDVEVLFGGVAAEVLAVEGDAITVETPAAASDGEVDVVVRTASAAGTAEAAFRYWIDGTGLVGAIGSVAWWDTVGDYWADDPVDEGVGWLAFNEPADVSFYEVYGSSLDRCESGYAFDWSSVSYYESGAASVVLRGTRTITLPDVGDGLFEGDITSSEFLAGSSYDLDPVEGASYWPDVEVEDLVETPRSFEVYTPAIDGATVPYVTRPVDLWWSTTGAGDYMVVSLARYSTSDVLQERVYCALEDDGYFSIPSSAFNGWDIGQVLYINIGRVVVADAVLPWDGSRAEVAGVYWLSGAAYTY